MKITKENLKDESGLVGYADEIFYPENIFELKNYVLNCYNTKTQFTIQGSKTGVVGGAVPFSGNILNLSKFNNIIEFMQDKIKVQSGTTLLDIKKSILQNNQSLFFPINPTEDTATIGGIISSNARGFNEMAYGNISNYIHEILIILPNGKELLLNKKDPSFKNFIGSEGGFGIIAEVTLNLIEKKKNIWGIVFFFENFQNSFSFIESLKPIYSEICTIEYIDKNCIDLIENNKKHSAKIKNIPDIKNNFNTIIYIEIENNDCDVLESIVENIIEKGMDFGVDPDEAWVFDNFEQVQRMRDFRHGILEFILLEQNKKIQFQLKIQDKNYGEVAEYIMNHFKKINDLKYYIFGHCDTNLVNCYIISEQKYIDEIEKLIEYMYHFSYQNSNFINEYGVGKLYNKFYKEYNKTDFEIYTTLKKKYDPKSICNIGNVVRKND